MQVGQHVHLKFHPELWGTISKISPDGRFLVTWHTPGRRRGSRAEPRSRFWYTREALVTGIKVGVPEA